MIKIHIQTGGKQFRVPVPYGLLHLGVRLLTSKSVITIANRSIKKSGQSTFQLPILDRQTLKPLLRELSRQKGLPLVETQSKDGTNVSITL